MFFRVHFKLISASAILSFCCLSVAAVAQEYGVCKSLTDGGLLLDRYNVEQFSDVQYRDFLDFCGSKSNRVDRARKKNAAWKSAAQYSAQIKGFGNLDLSSDDASTSAMLDKMCLSGGSEFRQYFRSNTASVSGELVSRYFTECINILANAQVDAIGGEVWADPDISTRFHVKITRSVRSPTTDYVFDAASKGTTCQALGERVGAPDNTARQLKSELGLTCDARAPTQGILTGQLSFRAYEARRDILIGGAKTLRYTVVSYSTEKQISDSVESRVQALKNTLERQISDGITQMRGLLHTPNDFYLKEMPGTPQDTGWYGCDGDDALVSAACTNSNRGQAAVGPTFKAEGNKRLARCQRYATGNSAEGQLICLKLR